MLCRFFVLPQKIFLPLQPCRSGDAGLSHSIINPIMAMTLTAISVNTALPATVIMMRTIWTWMVRLPGGVGGHTTRQHHDRLSLSCGVCCAVLAFGYSDQIWPPQSAPQAIAFCGNLPSNMHSHPQKSIPQPKHAFHFDQIHLV